MRARRRIALQAQLVAQALEKGRLGRIAHSVSLANADCQFISELTMLEFAQGRNGLRQRDAAQQHILVDTGQGGARPRQRFGGLANGFALGVGLLAIDECSVDEDVQYGALFGSVH